MNHTLSATQEVPDTPISTREEARGSRTHPGEPRFRLRAPDEGSFPCFVGKEFQAFPSHLKRRHSPQERREELQCRATIPRVPQSLDIVVYTADMIEPTRVYEALVPLRELVGQVSLDDLFAECFRATVEHLVAKRRYMHPETAEIWNTWVAGRR